MGKNNKKPSKSKAETATTALMAEPSDQQQPHQPRKRGRPKKVVEQPEEQIEAEEKKLQDIDEAESKNLKISSEEAAEQEIAPVGPSESKPQPSKSKRKSLKPRRAAEPR